MSLTTTSPTDVALCDSVSGLAFGPTFASPDHAWDFAQWAAERFETDLRSASQETLHDWYDIWFDERVDADTGVLLDGEGA